LELILPHSDSVAVASAAVAGYVKRFHVRIGVLSNCFPPARNALNREFACVVACPDIYKTDVFVDVINSVWRDFPEFLNRKIVVENYNIFSMS
jgi:hypothetical protein